MCYGHASCTGRWSVFQYCTALYHLLSPLAAVGDDAGDLFSHYTNSNGAHVITILNRKFASNFFYQGDLNTFLELVSGWASDGMQLPPQMLRSMLRQANLSQEGRKTIVALVSKKKKK